MAWSRTMKRAPRAPVSDGSYFQTCVMGIVEGLEDGASIGQQGAAAPAGISPSSVDAYLSSGGVAARDTVREHKGYLLGRKISATIFSFARADLGREWIQRMYSALGALLDHDDSIMDDVGQLADAAGWSTDLF
jgi:hypothetical protein